MAGSGPGSRLLEAAQLSAVRDVRREEVAGALNHLQRTVQQGGMEQQSLLSVFKFAEAVFSTSTCPWPNSQQEYEALTKGMTKILGQVLERLTQGSDAHLALLACERLVRLDRVTSSDTTLVLVWKGVVQLATAHHKSLADSFQCEEVMASLLSYAEDGEIKIRGVVCDVSKEVAANHPAPSASAPRNSSGDLATEYMKASRVLAFFLLRIALIVRAYGRRLSSSTLERVCRVLSLLRGRLDPCHVAWLGVEDRSPSEAGPGAQASCASQIRQQADQGLVPKVEQTFLKTLGDDSDADDAGAPRPSSETCLTARLVGALGAVCQSATTRAAPPSNVGLNGRADKADQSSDDNKEALCIGALRLLCSALKASPGLPAGAQVKLCTVLVVALPSIAPFLYPSLMLRGEPLSHLYDGLIKASSSHLLRTTASAAAAVQVRSSTQSFRQSSVLRWLISPLCFWIMLMMYKEVLFGQLLQSAPHPLLRELWLGIWQSFLSGCVPGTRARLLHLLSDMADAEPVGMERRAFLYQEALPQLLHHMDSQEDRAAILRRWVVRVSSDSASWGRARGAVLSRALLRGLQVCPTLITSPSTAADLMKPMVDALLGSTTAASAPAQAMHGVGVVRVLAAWEDAHTPAFTLPSQPQLANSLMLLAKVLPLEDTALLLSVATTLRDHMGASGRMSQLLTSYLTGLQSGAPKTKAVLLATLPRELSHLTRHVLTDPAAELRQDAQVMDLLCRLWSCLLDEAKKATCWSLKEGLLQGLAAIQADHRTSGGEAGSTLSQILRDAARAVLPDGGEGLSRVPGREGQVAVVRSEGRALRELKNDVMFLSSLWRPCTPPASDPPRGTSAPRSARVGGAAAGSAPTMELQLGKRAFLLPLSDPSGPSIETFGVLLLSRDVSESVSVEEARQLLLKGMQRPAEGNVYGVDLLMGQQQPQQGEQEEEEEAVVLRLSKRPKHQQRQPQSRATIQGGTRQ